MDGQNLTKFCRLIIIDKIYFAIVNIIFRKFARELRPLIDFRNGFFARYLETGWTEFNQMLYTHYH